jgi:hypothetical protein
MNTRLMLGAATPLRVTLNGKEVYRGTPATGPVQPDEIAVEFELARGVNRLVVEGQGAVYVRFHDPDRKLAYPEPPTNK